MPFSKRFYHLFDVYTCMAHGFGMSFYKDYMYYFWYKEVIHTFFYCVLEQFNAIESTQISYCLACALQGRNKNNIYRLASL